jgi:outer membrane protein TolC
LDIETDPVPAVAQPDDRYPITLPTALHLAGSSNLQVALAQERVREAYARLDGAKVLWVPNISGGLGFNDHAGQLQNIEGQILEINRQSLFVGGGAGFGGTPLAGGANPPPRMGIDLSPVDVIFEPLAARQRANRARFDVSVAFNDTLLNVSYVYLELVRAQSQVAIAREAIANTEALERITSDFARTGLGLEADAQRARGELAERRRELLSGEERVRVTSAELARLLRLDPNTVLFALESQPVPIELISEQVALDSLIAQGLRARPEISRENAQVESIDSRIAQERWRPWVPNLHVGVGGGTFGGGRNDDFGDFSGRYDLDALAVWEVRNLGFGNRALVRERESQYRQACIDYQSWRDRVGQEVAAAYHQAALRREQITFAEQQIAAAADALPLNFNGIRGRELRPIEAQQAIAALALARNRYVNSVVDYNQAQLALWRAVGHPPDASASMAASSATAPPAPAAE